MSVRATIENAVRAWLVLAGAAGGVPAADAAVVFADQDAVRPPLPYLTVRVVTYDVPVHEDEDLVDDADPPTWRGRGLRTATVAVNAYGAGADAWLERAVFMLRAPSVLAQLEAAGVAVRALGGLNNLSALLDAATQVRFQRDFAVDYRREAAAEDAESLIELAEVVHADTWESEPADRTETVTIEVS